MLIWAKLTTFPSRVPASAVLGLVARRPAGDHHHSASQLLGLVISGSAGGAGGGGLSGEGGRRAAPHGGQRTLWRPAAVGVGQDACWDGKGQRGETRGGKSGVSDGGQADEPQVVLQPTRYGGGSEGRSYVFLTANEMIQDEKVQETKKWRV